MRASSSGCSTTFTEVAWKRLDRALRIHPPELVAGGWLDDFGWYGDYLRRLLTSLAELPLIQRETNQPITLTRALVLSTQIEVTDTILEEYAVTIFRKEASIRSRLNKSASWWGSSLNSKVRSSTILSAIVDYVQRSFLRFVLQYVASVDLSWQARKAVECECGSNHDIIRANG